MMSKTVSAEQEHKTYYEQPIKCERSLVRDMYFIRTNNTVYAALEKRVDLCIVMKINKLSPRLRVT